MYGDVIKLWATVAADAGQDLGSGIDRLQAVAMFGRDPPLRHRRTHRPQRHRINPRLGRHRWIVEACLSWLLNNRRLVRRYDRKAEHFQAFADLGCILLCYHRWTMATT
jgi:hypothetical protein